MKGRAPWTILMEKLTKGGWMDSTPCDCEIKRKLEINGRAAKKYTALPVMTGYFFFVSIATVYFLNCNLLRQEIGLFLERKRFLRESIFSSTFFFLARKVPLFLIAEKKTRTDYFFCSCSRCLSLSHTLYLARSLSSVLTHSLQTTLSLIDPSHPLATPHAVPFWQSG